MNPSVKQYWQWGAVLNGATHGHTIKQKDLPMAMATEMPTAWGQAKHRYFFSGHLHHDHVKFSNGVRCVQVTAPIPPDAYHASGPYSSSAQIMYGFVQHKERGQIASIEYTL